MNENVEGGFTVGFSNKIAMPNVMNDGVKSRAVILSEVTFKQ